MRVEWSKYVELADAEYGPGNWDNVEPMELHETPERVIELYTYNPQPKDNAQ